MTLWNQTLAAFRDDVASARPTPGGGSVCAVTASLGLGLVIMALEITQKRARDERRRDQLERAQTLLRELTDAADDDVRAFDEYMRAHRLAQSSEDEQRHRYEQLERAAQSATRVPLLAARQIVEALELAANVEVSPHVRSDVVAGTELLHASLKGLFATLAMNLDTVDSRTRVAAIAERDELAARAAATQR